MPVHPQPEMSRRRMKRRGRFGRFVRGYLMVAGSLATLYALVQLVVWLLVEAAKWRLPIL